MRKITATLLVSLMAFSAYGQDAKAWEKEPTSFNGIELGKPLEESGIQPCPAGTSMLDLYKVEERCYVKSGSLIYIGKFPFEFAREGYARVDEAGNVSAIQLSFPQAKFQIMLDTLVERYGPPTDKREKQVGNLAGASASNVEAIWQGKKVMITTVERFMKMHTSVLTVMLTKFAEDDSAKRREAAKSTASQL